MQSTNAEGSGFLHLTTKGLVSSCYPYQYSDSRIEIAGAQNIVVLKVITYGVNADQSQHASRSDNPECLVLLRRASAQLQADSRLQMPKHARSREMRAVVALSAKPLVTRRHWRRRCGSTPVFCGLTRLVHQQRRRTGHRGTKYELSREVDMNMHCRI